MTGDRNSNDGVHTSRKRRTVAMDGQTAPPSVYAVVNTFNRPELLEQSVVRALGQDHGVERLVVVDNGDNEPVDVDGLRNLVGGDRVTVLHPGANLGPAGGLAFAFQQLEDTLRDHDYVLVLDDDDPLPSESIVRELLVQAEDIAVLDQHFGGIGLRGARFDARRLRTRTVDPRSPSPQLVDHLHGGFAPMYAVRALRAVGGFRADLFWGFEELELGLRLSQSGWNLYMATDLYERTNESRPASRPSFRLTDSSVRRYYTLRNLLYLGLNYSSRWTVWRVAVVRGILKPIASLPCAPVAASRQLRLNILAIKHAMCGQLGRTLSW